MSALRLLTKEEKRLITDALRAAAKEARRAKGHALTDPRFRLQRQRYRACGRARAPSCYGRQVG
jgi:hypothetical protein